MNTQKDSTISSVESWLIPSREAIIDRIVQISKETPGSTATEEEREVRGLIQALVNHKGAFGILFAVCNEILKRDNISQRVISSLPDQCPVEFYIQGAEASLLDALLKVSGAPRPLLVYGIERLLPSGEMATHVREQLLSELQLRREQFRALGRPVVLWMPDYVYTLIGQQAVDFWSWQSGAFFFTKRRTTNRDLQRSGFSDSGYKDTLVGSTSRHYVNAAGLAFVGRKQQLAEILDAAHGGQVVLLLGRAGGGKTSLMIRAVEVLRNDYPDAQLFLTMPANADGPLAVFHTIREAIRALDSDAFLADDLALLTSVYTSLLKGKKAVIAIDDVPDHADLSPLIPPAGSFLIASSRGPVDADNARIVVVDRLLSADAYSLLARFLPGVNKPLAKNICRLCDYAPLAIKFAGSLISVGPNLSAVEYKEELIAARKSLKRAKEDTERGLEAAFLVTLKHLRQRDRQILGRLEAFMGTFDLMAEEPIAKDPGNEGLDRLIELNLVTRIPSERFRLDVGVRNLIRKHAVAEDRGEVLGLHASYYLNVAGASSELYVRGGIHIQDGLALFDTEWENIAAGQSWAALRLATDKGAARICSAYAEAVKSLMELRHTPSLWRDWLESAITAAKQLDDHAALGKHLNRLGGIMAILGDFAESIRYHDQALAIARESSNRVEEGAALANLGKTHAELGDYNRATDYHNSALAIAREIGDRRGEEAALVNLGWTLAVSGKPRDGIGLYEESLAIARELGDRRVEGIALRNLGNAYSLLGELRLATDFYEDALVIFEALNDKRSKGSVLDSLGRIDLRQGRTDAAIRSYRRALAIARELGDRRAEGTTLGNLGTAHRLLGDYRSALSLLEGSMEIARKTGNRRAEAAALGSLGQTYLDLYDFRRAIRLYEQSLAIANSIGDRRAQARSLRNLGFAYSELGEYRLALKSYEQTLDVSREMQNSFGEAEALGNLGLVYARLGERDKAIDCGKRSLDLARESRNPRARSLALRVLGSIHTILGNWHAAIDYLTQALGVTRKVNDQPRVAEILWNLSLLVSEVGNRSEAVSHAQAALRIYTELNDPNASKVKEQLDQWLSAA
jgi:tetratricopeptide (TPR) repeat protein